MGLDRGQKTVVHRPYQAPCLFIDIAHGLSMKIWAIVIFLNDGEKWNEKK